MPKLVESDGRKSKVKSANQKDRSFFYPYVTKMIENDMIYVKQRRKIVKASYRLKNTIIHGGSTALWTADTVDTVNTVDTVDNVDMVYTVDMVYIVYMTYDE